MKENCGIQRYKKENVKLIICEKTGNNRKQMKEHK